MTAVNPNANAGDGELVTDVRANGDTLLARLHGEIDLHNSPDLRGQLLRTIEEFGKKPKRVVLDLSGVPYMDSSGVAVLVEVLRRTADGKSGVCLVGLQPRVQGLLEIARLNTIFKICKDEAEALK